MPGGKVFIPGMFPPAQETSENQELFPEIPPEDLQEVIDDVIALDSS
jgi:hypothetical protein